VLRVDGNSCIFSEPVYGPDCGAAHKVRVHHQSKNGLTDRHDDYAELAGESGQSDQLMLDGGRAESDRVTREYGNLKSQIQKGRPRPITKGRTDSATINFTLPYFSCYLVFSRDYPPMQHTRSRVKAR
jgi:hypothetical protein